MGSKGVHPTITKGDIREQEGCALQDCNSRMSRALILMGSGVVVKNNFSWTTINNTVINICEQLLFSKELLQAERKTTFEVQRTPFCVTHEAI